MPACSRNFWSTLSTALQNKARARTHLCRTPDQVVNDGERWLAIRTWEFLLLCRSLRRFTSAPGTPKTRTAIHIASRSTKLKEDFRLRMGLIADSWIHDADWTVIEEPELHRTWICQVWILTAAAFFFQSEAVQYGLVAREQKPSLGQRENRLTCPSVPVEVALRTFPLAQGLYDTVFPLRRDHTHAPHLPEQTT